MTEDVLKKVLAASIGKLDDHFFSVEIQPRL